MSERKLSETIAEMRIYVRRQVVAGFDTPSAITQSTVEVFCDDAEEKVLLPIAERLTQEFVAAKLREQAAWPDVTDCDHLDDAFEDLRRSGIVCRQNFSCCGNCGMAEIGDEIRKEREAGLVVRGYAFYHMQDTESAADGSGLYLNYGPVPGGEVTAVQVGRLIVETIERHGLATKWNGSVQSRIHVRLEWKRRRPFEVRAKPSALEDPAGT